MQKTSQKNTTLWVRLCLCSWDVYYDSAHIKRVRNAKKFSHLFILKKRIKEKTNERRAMKNEEELEI